MLTPHIKASVVSFAVVLAAVSSMAETFYVNADRGMMLKAKRPADDRGGIWLLELIRVKDDCSFRIGAGAVPVASGSPEAALTLAE